MRLLFMAHVPVSPLSILKLDDKVVYNVEIFKL